MTIGILASVTQPGAAGIGRWTYIGSSSTPGAGQFSKKTSIAYAAMFDATDADGNTIDVNATAALIPAGTWLDFDGVAEIEANASAFNSSGRLRVPIITADLLAMNSLTIGVTYTVVIL